MPCLCLFIDCSCSNSWLLYLAIGLGGLSLFLVIILILVMAKTRRQLSVLHAAIKNTKDGYLYPFPLAPLPPAHGARKKLPLKSNSSDDSGVLADTCTVDDSESASSTINSHGPEPARQNTYVQENNQNNKSSYEQLTSGRDRNSYQKISSGNGSYEPMRTRRKSSHKYQGMGGASEEVPYTEVIDDTVSQASTHAYELLPGMSSQPGSRAGSVRTRGNVPLSIAEQSEDTM